MTKVLLYSGGMDSWLIDKIWKPDIKLYIDIGGAYSWAERRRLPSDVVIVDLPFLGTQEQGDAFVPLRNLYFLMVASHYGDEICLGATAGDWGNVDKTPQFLEDAEKLISALWMDKKVKKEVRIEKSFVCRPKTDLLAEYLKEGNINTVRESTFSCYTPRGMSECFSCYPCFRKFAILYAYGCYYSLEERKRMWEYVRENIIPTAEEGGYEGTYYTDRGDESIHLIKAVDLLKEEFDEQTIGQRIWAGCFIPSRL